MQRLLGPYRILGPVTVVALVATACATVSYAPSDDGGTGGSGASPTSANGGSGNAGNAGGAGGTGNVPSTGSIITGPVQTTTGPMPVSCEETCERSTCIPIGDCLAACDNVASECEHLLIEALECYDAEAGPSCAFDVSACEPIFEEYDECTGGSRECVGECAAGSAGDCSCYEECPNAVLSTYCSPQPDGTTNCVCQIDGETIAGCSYMGPPDIACDVHEGCCAGFFFEG